MVPNTYALAILKAPTLFHHVNCYFLYSTNFKHVFYIFIICQVLVFRGVVYEYSNNKSRRLYQQVGQGDLVDGKLAQESRACVNVVFMTS